ncbi:hypothetical protein AX14_013472 [Amanita brunnescens Koide BX004]|nr:hypothetical protein AX14_013472 [Amanita brunnescens Koide BX004]
MIIIFFPISALRYSRRIPSLHLHRFISQAPDVLPVPPCLKSIDTPEDKLAARTWILEFKKLAIPKRLVGFTFARSSGPGGQNVNKVNTKASLRCGLDAPWIPAWAKPELRRSTHYVASTDEVLITSTVHRSQAQNIEECLSQVRPSSSSRCTLADFVTLSFTLSSCLHRPRPSGTTHQKNKRARSEVMNAQRRQHGVKKSLTDAT